MDEAEYFPTAKCTSVLSVKGGGGLRVLYIFADSGWSATHNVTYLSVECRLYKTSYRFLATITCHKLPQLWSSNIICQSSKTSKIDCQSEYLSMIEIKRGVNTSLI